MHTHMKNCHRLLILLLAVAIMIIAVPLTAYGTNYNDIKVTKLERNDENLITSITIRFTTSDTFASSWCLALYDKEIPYKSGQTTSSEPQILILLN